MDIVVTGRHVTVSDRFRTHIEEKLAKVEQLAPRVQRIDVMVTHEANRRQSKACDRVEITCHVKGSVIRAEACVEDKYAALDTALDKLAERLRRAGDKRRVHRGRHTPESVAQATARVEASSPAGVDGSNDAPDAGDDGGTDRFGALGDSPIEVREKIHTSPPMSLEQALHMMELVGHDFYLFHDSETDRPSVVYRRRGWSYGVLHLETVAHGGEEDDLSAAS
ncbi:MAG: ribosome-associated translation inhibitor RaiA [Nostocoides sp.]